MNQKEPLRAQLIRASALVSMYSAPLSALPRVKLPSIGTGTGEEREEGVGGYRDTVEAGSGEAAAAASFVEAKVRERRR